MPPAIRIALAASLLGLGGVVGAFFTVAFAAWLLQMPLLLLGDAPSKPRAWSGHLHALRDLGLLALLGWCAWLIGARVSRGVAELHKRWVPIGAVIVATPTVIWWVAR